MIIAFCGLCPHPTSGIGSWQDAIFERIHLIKIDRPPVGEKQYQCELHELRRLEARNAQFNPSMYPVLRRHEQHDDQQQKAKAQNPDSHFMEMMVVEK